MILFLKKGKEDNSSMKQDLTSELGPKHRSGISAINSRADGEKTLMHVLMPPRLSCPAGWP